MANPISWTDLIVPNGGIDQTGSQQQIDPRKWASAENVEPLFDGVRARNGSAAMNATAIPAINTAAQYEGGTAAHDMEDGVTEYVSQGFQIGGTGVSIFRIGVRLRKTPTGSPTGDIEAQIETDSSGDPSGTPVTNLTYANSISSGVSDIDASALSTDFEWVYFSWWDSVGSTDYSTALTASTTYHLIIKHTGAAAAPNTIDVELAASGNNYTTGQANESADGAAWDATGLGGVATADLNFRVYDTTNTSVLTMVADYRLSDATTTRHLVMADGEVYKMDSASSPYVWTAVSTRDRTDFTIDDDVLPSWAVGQDRFFMTNNTEVSKKFYILSATEYWENEGIAAPTADLGVGAGASGGSLVDGDEYHFDYYYWNSDIGQPSDRRYQGLSTPSHTIATPALQIDLTGIPATTVREGDRATHVRIEMKKSTDAVFKLVEEVTLGTTSVTISTDDRTIEAQYRHAVPPTHKIKCVAENRQFIANVVDGSTNRPYRLMWSEIIGATPYYESYPANNFSDFGRGDGDYITALAFMPPRTLVVGLRNSIWAIDSRFPGRSDRFLISKHVGIASAHSFKVINQKLYFLSDSLNAPGFYMLTPGQEPQEIPGVDDAYKDLSNGRMKYASCASLHPGDNRHQWWTLLSSGGTKGDRLFVYDYALNAWTIYTKGSGLEGNIIGNIELSGIDGIYMGGYTGVHYQQDSGQTTDAGTAFSSKMKMKVFDFGDPQTKKRLRFMENLLKAFAAGAVSVDLDFDYGEGTKALTLQHIPPSASAFILGPNTPTGGSTLGGPDLLGGDGVGETRLRKLDGINRVFKTMQPQFSSDTNWHLRGVAFGVQPTKRR
jgi:hypothetical protein